ncbi:glutathione S-transferase theta-2B-like isoform X3 [Ursus maritimus]|uniref:glutathione transferase n=1 Tax=Ursus maritimus TaxID=29073 RepID=A0A8M1F3A6_URSMA|nr:glutathione S-transferase theta-2B-like isoform X3 [Ursus maritimus]XP_040475439.1 glutathione S-transferase theta-2B-like isoform X3 [Ursus maritimus]XP_040475440.1 glutathione S-transferase theta-2B-like isoform X3 [Ursus maritimus]
MPERRSRSPGVSKPGTCQDLWHRRPEKQAGPTGVEPETLYLGAPQSCHSCCPEPAVRRVPAAATMGLELYLDMLSQPCRAVSIFAKKNGIPFKLCTTEVFKGQHPSKEFFQINSLRRVPTLKDGDFILTESSAILIYLSSKYQTADHWYPSDLRARARVHEYLGWHADCIRGTFGVPLWTQVMAPLIGVHVPEEKVQRNKTFMDLALQQLEEKFLGDRAFVAGQQVSLADLMALEELLQPVAVGCDLFEGRPRLAAWRERVEAFLGSDLLQETRGPILNILEQAVNKKVPTPPPEVHPCMLLRISRIP